MAYFSIKTRDETTVKAILNNNTSIEFSGLNVLQQSLTLNSPVFIVLGGDQPDWATGLAGMGVISKEPYDVGYKSRNFKIQVDVKLLLPKTIKREDLVPYRDTYGTIGIAPITKGEPNQALSQVQDCSAIGLMRAMIELFPEVYDGLRAFVGDAVFNTVLGPTTKMFPYSVSYGKEEREAVQEFIDSQKDNTSGLQDEAFTRSWNRLIEDVKNNENKLIIDLARSQHTLVWKNNRFYDTAYTAGAVAAPASQFVDYDTVKSVYLGTYPKNANSGTNSVKYNDSKAIIKILSEKYGLTKEIPFAGNSADNRPEVERYEIDWHALEPTEKEYANFKALLNFFVSQLDINNDLIPGEKRFVDSGKPNSRAFVEKWKFNGFELSCKFAKGYQKAMDNASYLNYCWVNINPRYDRNSKAVESLKVNVKPDMNLCYEGQPYSIASLDLSSDNKPNEQLKNLFIEFRDEIYKWQCGEYTYPQIEEEKEICYKTSLNTNFSRNRIIFGAPGTGKSYTLNKECEELIGEDNEADYERVTFHPDYSYANFVGTYKPVPIDDDGITYEYVPGPFMRVYVNALKNGRTDTVKPFLLIIEEINRANVAAVFGDIFQLLDRDDDGVSEYPIQASEDMKKYLAKELGGTPDDYGKIKLPNNLFIWATMNSADQGVFPMDTAFKRRWDFTYLGIDDSDNDIRGKYVMLGRDSSQKVEWNKLRQAINRSLAGLGINEDKQLGPYFISRSIVVPSNGSNEIDRDRFIDTFKNKVIMYLFEDAAKQKRPKLFGEGKTRYSEICEAFDNTGIKIFNSDIQNDIAAEMLQHTSNEGDN